MVKETAKYFRGEDSRDHFVDVKSTELYSLATLLDPRFNKCGFSSADKANTAATLLMDKLNEIVFDESSHSVVAATADQDDWVTCMGSQDQDADSDSEVVVNSINITVEFNAYMREKNMSRGSSPFVWWSANEKYPHLKTLARRYLCSPMASIASEREFKVAKRVTCNRWSLKPENVEKLLFLKYNLRMCNYKY